jgi:hypothetical protein
MKPDPPGSFTRETEVSRVTAISEIPLSRFNTRLIRNYGMSRLQAKQTDPGTGSCIGYDRGKDIPNRTTEIERHQDISSEGGRPRQANITQEDNHPKTV